MSSKNTLQEIFQRLKLTLPKYDTQPCGGLSHTPLWKATVILANGLSFDGQVSKDKVTAEKSAAEVALNYINTTQTFSPEPEIIKTLTKRVVILVDVENMPKAVTEILSRIIISNLSIYAFVGSTHPSASVDWGSRVNKVIVSSSRPNGADVCMTLYMGAFLSSNQFDEYLIVTKDHFATTLAEISVSPDMLWKFQSVKVMTKVADVLEYLRNN